MALTDKPTEEELTWAENVMPAVRSRARRRQRRTRAAWLTGAVIAAVATTAVAVALTSGPGGPKHVNVTGPTGGSHGRAPSVSPGSLESITAILVRRDDRTLVVSSSWGGCYGPPRLRVLSEGRNVRVALQESRLALTNCPADIMAGSVDVVAPEPVGNRVLIDARTGRSIPTAKWSTLVTPSELPDGLSLAAAAPDGLQLAPGIQSNEVVVLTYTSKQAGTPEVQLSEAPTKGSSIKVPTDGVSVRIGGHPATLVDHRDAGVVDRRELFWDQDGKVLTLVTMSGQRRSNPLSTDRLLAIARGIKP